MSPFRWLSLAVAAVSVALVTAIMLYTVGPAWRHAGGSYTDIVLAACLVGATVGGLLWLVAGAYDAELRRGVALAGSRANSGTSPHAFRGHFGLDALIEAVQQAEHHTVSGTATPRKEGGSDAAADAARRHLDAVLASIGEAVIVTDAFNEIVLANQAAADLLRFSLQAATRRPVDQVIADPAVVRMIHDVHEGGRCAPGFRRQVQHRIGRGGETAVYDVRLQCVPARTGGADAAAASAPAGGVVMVLRDITREVETAERRSEFVASVSHELRTPLSSIKGCLEMLIDGEATDAATRSEFYNIIQSETNRLSRLIDNILNISRIESGVSKARREAIRLAEVVREAVASAAPQARAKQIELTCEGGDEGSAATADREMILDVLHNLLSNAIKYTQPGGVITVTIARDETRRELVVAVKDTGVGIPPEALPHVFDKFFRVADHTRLAKGTGLGLNLVKHVVETVHGGKVGVESAVGRGSTFTFSLPMTEETLGGEPVASSQNPDGARLWRGS